jgi:hypothetical protein
MGRKKNTLTVVYGEVEAGVSARSQVSPKAERRRIFLRVLLQVAFTWRAFP